MKVPFTRKILQDWSGPQIFREAQRLWERDAVIDVDYDPPMVNGRIASVTTKTTTSLAVAPTDIRIPTSRILKVVV